MSRKHSGTYAAWIALLMPVLLASLAMAADLGAYTLQRTEILRAAKDAVRQGAEHGRPGDAVATVESQLTTRLDPAFERQIKLVDLDGTPAINLRVERPFDAPTGVLPFPERIGVAVTLPLGNGD